MKKNILFCLLFIIFFSCSSKTTTPAPPELLSQADERLVRGNDLLQQGDYDEAGFNYLKSYTDYSLSDDLNGCGASLAGLGISLFRQDRKSEAELVLKKAEKYFVSSNNSQELLAFYVTKALILIEYQKYDEAESLLNHVKEKGLKDQRIMPALALISLKTGRSDDAENYLTYKNNSSFYYYVSGLFDFENGNFETSKSNLEKALEIDKTKGNVAALAADLEALSNLYIKTNDHQKASDFLLRSIKINILTNKIDKANKLIERLKQISPDNNTDMSVENFFIELWMNR
ncbi:MAG: hypothetical protein H6681_00015 [Desulfobacteraceae bacterium]|nr:hypothetical protein [Desulfobacteraceae bacterium]